MRFVDPLIPATLVRRYKRFLADVVLEDGSTTTVHCPNTGAMLGCDQPGSNIWLQRFESPSRKYPLGWEMVEARPGILVGINTARTNALVHEALIDDGIAELTGYRQIEREVRVDHGRLDFRLSADGRPDCMLEVKNVTAAVTRGEALFPDAVSERASRHVTALIEQRRRGLRSVLLFCVQRSDVDRVVPARDIDPVYADTVNGGLQAGVEVLAYRCSVSVQEIRMADAVDFRAG